MNRRGVAVTLTLLALLAAAVPFAASVGAVPLTPGGILRTIADALAGKAPADQTGFILLFVRLPRICAAALVGASLALAGAAMQGLFRNPMASPDILGISAGAGLGAVLAISTGAAGLFLLPVAAAAGSMGAALAIYLLSSYRNRTSLLFVVLAGMALSSFLNGLVSLVLLFAQQYEIRQFLFWTMGGFENRRWEHIAAALPFLLPAGAAILLLSDDLNLFLYGEESAHSLGMRVERRKRLLLILASILTGVSVSLSGTIGFVGLIIPHLFRFVVGSDHRNLLPASAAGGALFLLLADTLARSILPPFEIRVGIVTSLLGAPYFLSLIVRAQRKGAGGYDRGATFLP